MNLRLTPSVAMLTACALPQLLPAADLQPLVITITGTRTAQPAQESLAPVTVITQQDIERTQAKSVPELLQKIPSVNVTVQGGYGKNSAVFLRGTNSSHVLVLIDGVRISSATTGTAAFQNLPVSEIDHVEVVRGPRSSLYGSDAIGGVIQIFTRKGREGLRFGSSVGYGTYDTREVTANLSGGKSGTTFSLSASHFKTRGFNATKPGSFFFEPDNDGYENNAVAARIGHQFAGGLNVDLHFLRAQGHNLYDDAGTLPTNDTVEQVLGLNVDTPVTSLWRTQFKVAESRDDLTNNDTAFPGFFDTVRHSIYWQNDLQLAKGQLLTLGVDYYRDKVDSSTAFTRNEADNVGIFAQHQARLGRHEIIAGVRREETDAFGGETTGSLAWGYDVLDPVRLTASFGTGFHTPTFNDLFFPEDPFFVGNPNLKPEQSYSVELGLKGSHRWGGWSVNVFKTRIDDLIVPVFDPDLGKFTVRNLAAADIKGVELGLDTVLAGWDLELALSLQDPEDADTGNRLPRRSKKSLHMDLDRSFGRASAGLSVLYEGKRYDDLANEIGLGGYTLVNSRASYALRKDLTVYARVDNLFDKDYETAHLFSSAGRNFFLSVNYQMR